MSIDGESYIDRGTGTHNPTREALKEIQGVRIIKNSSRKLLIISIGSGARPQVETPTLKSITTLTLQTLQSIAADAEDVHKDMERISKAEYIESFCFNVDSDLEDLLFDGWSVKKVHGGKIFETIDTIARKTPAAATGGRGTASVRASICE